MFKLNTKQREVFETILSAVYKNQTNSPKSFFLEGSSGAGKTYLYKTLSHTMRGKGDLVTPVASTGIAAILLNGGRIAHSVF